ncbi:MAG TPA: FUSC family protein, partial [Thermomicrobiales bacterium]|nr:FUSC family protein [Thermomicrobiales bacterium]
PFDDVSKIIMSRVVLAVTLSSLISIPLGMSHAYWVIMTAGVLLQTGHTLDVPTIRAIQRVVGTLLGGVIFSLLSRLHPSGFEIVVIVALGQCLTEVVIVRNYGLGLLFITPLALTIATANRTAHPLAVSEDRILDTLLGAAIALTVLYGTEWLRSRLWQRVEA